ncbi:MAG: guanylate kinase [Actinomycetota bacterium]|nr:guanylate kinase [Actinomycetota bacterium]
MPPVRQPRADAGIPRPKPSNQGNDPGRLFIISGPGGAGKGSIVSRVVASDPSLWLSRSWTTRVPRSGEAEDAYCFVTREDFKAKIASGGFLEWAEVVGELYGTPVPEAPAGSDVVLEIDVQGAAQVLGRRPDARMILVLAPSREAQEQRLRGRGDSEEHILRRLRIAPSEENAGRRLADHVVINDDLERTVAEVCAIISRYRGNVASG